MNMRKLLYKRIILICCVFTISYTQAQKRNLSAEQMLKGKPSDVLDPLPSAVGWIDDSHLLLSRKTNRNMQGGVYLVDCKTGKESVSSEKALKKDLPLKSVFIRDNNIYIKEVDGEEYKLTDDEAQKFNPTLSPDGGYVAFTKKNDLFTIDLLTKKETRLTNDGSDVILNGYASWVYMEEILGRASRYRAFWWSPDSKKIAFFRSDDSEVPLFNIVSEEGQHGVLIKERYPKPGDSNPKVKVGVVSPAGGNIVWGDFSEDDDQYFGLPYWRPDGHALWVQWMNRGEDHLVIYEVDVNNGSKKPVYDEKQKTWVDLDDMGKRISFLRDGKRFILQSDKTGWNMLYLYDVSGKLLNAITTGEYTVSSINYIDEKNQLVYFTCRKDNSTCFDLYSVKFNGQKLQRLTFGSFNHAVNLSPGGSYFVTTYSNTATPGKMALVNNNGKVIKELGDAKGSGFENYELARTEIVRVKSEDGLFDLPMKIIWPLYFDSTKTYPVLISIYGGPDAGTVYDGFAFNGQQQWWAKEGLIQVSMDHRASGQFGKQGVNYMHRNLGYWEIKDWTQCVKWLIAHGANKEKIAISGFSYGGYITCYALTYGAEYFKYGVAGGSVTDWSLYDSHYTEKYMDTPRENPEGYKKSSVLTYIDKYRGLLRIYHGTMDDNVHLQNSLQLIKKLQDSKKHFEFMVYPGGLHGWSGNQSLHSSNENNLFIYKNLLEKEMPAEMWK
jgi:dipeptidyl-peptidase 4